jgi:hypothetical protein
MNFDGVSNGNPSPVGFWIVFRKVQGIICSIKEKRIGHDTNNSVEI